MTEELPYLVCAPAEGSQLPGSVTRSCSRCLRPVWIGQSSPYWSTPVNIICLPCAQILPKEMESRPMPLTEAQRLDIARHTGLHNEQLDQLVEEMEVWLGFPKREER